MPNKSTGVPVIKHMVTGYLASVVGMLNLARAGCKITLIIPQKGQVEIAYGRGKYSVNGRVLDRSSARAEILSALDHSSGATSVISCN